MDLLNWLSQNIEIFIIIIAIIGFAIFIAPLMCWIHCSEINKKLDKIITYLSSINDNTTLSLINSDEELQEKLLDEMENK